MVNINLTFARHKMVAVIDVAPGSASVAIARCPVDAPAHIISTGHSSFSLEKRSEDQERSQIAAQVKEAAEQAMKMYGSIGQKAPITEAYVIVHSPWTASALVNAGSKSAEDTKITDSQIATIAKNSVRDAEGIDPKRVMEASVIRLMLNGYQTSDPEGKMAHDVSVTSLVSDVDVGVKSALAGSVQQSFPVAKIAWRSGLRALMTIARESLNTNSFLLADMGATHTTMYSVHDHELQQMVVPEGVRTVLGRVAEKRSAEEVLGYLRMMARDACSSETCEAISMAIGSTEPELVRVFGEAMAKIAATRRIPNDVLLVAHDDMVQWLTTFLGRIDFAQFTVTSMPLSVSSAGDVDIAQWVAGAQSLDALSVGVALVNIEMRS